LILHLRLLLNSQWKVLTLLQRLANIAVKKHNESFGIKKQIEIISNFVDTEKFRPDQDKCNRSEFASKDEKIIAHMSNYRPVKNTHDVIRIFEIINKKIPSKLVLIGDGPDAPNILALAASMDLKDRVIFLGGQDSVESVLCKADLFLLPSASEAFGLAALEALACGVPVVGSIVGGLPELVKDGENGYLETIEDFEAMAEKSIKILMNDELQQKMSESARKLAVEKYETKNIIKKYYSFYEKVLSNGR